MSVNILDFVLYPLLSVQQVVLKLIYGIPLDNQKKFLVWDFDSGKGLNFTEPEYVHFLHDQGRCNVKDPEGSDPWEVALVVGRRGGKSMLAGIIAGYEMEQLLTGSNPQTRYGFPSQHPIGVSWVGMDKNQTQQNHEMLRSVVESHPVLKYHLDQVTEGCYKFKRPDQERSLLKVSLKTATPTCLRSSQHKVVILDEVEHYPSGKNVFHAVVPVLASFSPKDPQAARTPAGPCEGKIIQVSTPAATRGMLYERFTRGRDAKRTLCLQIPTWEMNPTIPLDFLQGVQNQMGEEMFRREFGAQFPE